MALTRKFLEALGIEQAKIDEIISAHTEVTDSLKADRDSYKEKAEKYDQTKTELDKAKSELDKVNKDEYKTKYESLEAEFNKYKTDIAEKEVKGRKEEAYKKMLKEISKETGIKGRNLYHSLRAAKTGEEQGPDLDKLSIIIGRDLMLERVKNFIKIFQRLD